MANEAVLVSQSFGAPDPIGILTDGCGRDAAGQKAAAQQQTQRDSLSPLRGQRA